jgi:hypothetical protein
MNKEDFIIQSEVRRMLVRANIDQTKMDFGTVRGVVYFRGVFQMINLPSGNEDAIKTYISKALFSFEKKIRGISGVSDIVFQFINWKKEMGHWIPITSIMRDRHRIERKEKEQGEDEGGKKEKDDEGQTDYRLPGDGARDPKRN